VTKESTNNFWNTCSRKLEYLPETPCKIAEESISSPRNSQKCEWWINSEDHNFCFWKFIWDRSKNSGNMEPLLQSEIAKLFDCSSTKVHFILRDALEKLQKMPDFRKLLELYKNNELFEDSEHSNSPEFESYVDDSYTEVDDF